MGKALRRIIFIAIVLTAITGYLQWRAYSKKVAWRSDALLYFEEEDYTKSINYLEKSLDQKFLFGRRLDRDMRCYLAESYYQMKEYEKAGELYQKLQKQDSDNALYYLLEGQCWKASGDYDRALQIFQKGWEKTKNADFLSRICGIFIEQKEYDKALEYARQGIGDGGSASAGLMYELIIIYEKSQDYEAAYQAARDYCEKYPEDDRAQKELIFLSSRV